MADLFRNIRRLCDHARVNLDLSNDVYKSGKVLFALCWCEIINSALILPLFLLIILKLFSWSMISWHNLYKHSREMDLQVLIIVIETFSFKKLYKTIVRNYVWSIKITISKNCDFLSFLVWFWEIEPEHSEPDRK